VLAVHFNACTSTAQEANLQTAHASPQTKFANELFLQRALNPLIF